MQIERENDLGRLSVNGRLEPEDVIELASSALAAAAAEQLRDLILNFKDLSLSRQMSLTECYSVGERLARAGRGLRRVAIITQRECGEPHQFALTVARNRGLWMATFRSESEAIGWLAS